MRKSIILTVVIMVSLLAVGAMAGDQKADISVSSEAKLTSFSGTMVCLGCSLKKAEGAKANCAEFGHTHALQTADGQYISLLENQYSKDLMGEKYHNQSVEVTGTMYASANVLDVDSFKVDGKTKSWCGNCKGMDGCSVK